MANSDSDFSSYSSRFSKSMTFVSQCAALLFVVLEAMLVHQSPVAIAQTLTWQQLNDQGIRLYRERRLPEAEAKTTDALALMETLSNRDDRNIAIVVHNLANIYDREQNYAKAEDAYKRAADIHKTLADPSDPETASLLNDYGVMLEKLGRYPDAEEALRKAVDSRKALPKPSIDNLATNLFNLATVYDDEGLYGLSGGLFVQALSLRRNLFGYHSLDVAETLSSMATLDIHRAQYIEAEQLAHQAVAITKGLSKNHKVEYASRLNDLGVVYDSQGKYSEAENVYKSALKLQDSILSPKDPILAMTLSNLGSVYLEQGRDRQAKVLQERALAVREASYGVNSVNIVPSLNNLATVYQDQGLYSEAERLYLRSRQIREKVYGPNHPAVATALNNLASLYREEGRYEEALSLCAEALRIRQGVLGANHPAVAESLNIQGGLYIDEGRYSEAEDSLRHALSIEHARANTDQSDLAVTLNLLGSVSQLEGRFDDAASFLKQAINLAKINHGLKLQDQIDPIVDLGALYDQIGSYSKAEVMYRAALSMEERHPGTNPSGLSHTLDNLALTLSNLKRYRDAESAFKRDISIRESILTRDHLDLAFSFDNLAGLYQDEGRYSDAEKLYGRALSIREASPTSSPEDLALLYANISTLYRREGRESEALMTIKKALALDRELLRHQFTAMSENQRLLFLNTIADEFPAFYSFTLDENGTNASTTGDMYNAVLWQKNMVAQSEAAFLAKIRANADKETLSIFEELKTKRAEVASLRGLQTRDLDLRSQRIVSLERDANDLEASLARKVSTIRGDTGFVETTWQDIQKTLKVNEAAIEFVRFDYHDGQRFNGKSYYVALLLSPDTSSGPIFVCLGEAAKLEALPLADYQNVVTNPPTRGAGHIFYRAFWEPLEQYLPKHGHVYVSLDGALNEVSLSVVPTQDGTPLMDKYDLDVVLSTRDLVEVTHGSLGRSAVLIGDPQFDLRVPQQRAALEKLGLIERSLTPEKDISRVTLPLDHRNRECPELPPGGFLCPLPGTEEELKGTFAALKAHKWEPEVPYSKELALEEVVKGVHGPRLLHIATHGFFLPTTHQVRSVFGAGFRGDPMLRSGLLLAGADRAERGQPSSSDIEDGVLTAYEASLIDLRNTELVVLSACETGVGQVEDGEGVFGLRRAFQEAGAGSVLMSMWSVSDTDTQELIGLFYEKWLLGLDKQNALREAEREMRGRVKDRWQGEDRPYYWGAFVLVGR